jgi:hypothetical protein
LSAFVDRDHQRAHSGRGLRTVEPKPLRTTCSAAPISARPSAPLAAVELAKARRDAGQQRRELAQLDGAGLALHRQCREAGLEVLRVDAAGFASSPPRWPAMSSMLAGRVGHLREQRHAARAPSASPVSAT